MGLGPIVVTVVIILVISAVVGAVAQYLNKVNDANTVNRRAVVNPPRAQAESPPAAGPAAAGKPVDMDRFLAEIDRLRRKNAQAAEAPKPAAQPVKPPPEKPRPRVMAEMAESTRGTASFPAPPPTSFPSAPPLAFPTAATSSPSGGQVTRLADLPQAMPISPATGMVGQPTRVTAPARRASAAPKTEFGKAFASLIGTGKGAALAVVLTEVLGPPKAQKRRG